MSKRTRIFSLAFAAAASVGGGPFVQLLVLATMSLPEDAVAQRGPTRLFPVQQNGKSGYIDERGTLVIPIEFDEAGAFSQGLAAVKIGGAWGYINLQGTTIIPPRFDQAFRFSEGLGRIKVGDRWGFVDTAGSVVVAAQFVDADEFKNGLAKVKVGAVYGYIDRAGKTVIAPRFELAGRFSEGLAAVRLEGAYGYVDTTGRIVIPPRFKYASQFSEGLAHVLSRSDELSYIDRSEHPVIALCRVDVTLPLVLFSIVLGDPAFSEGFAAVPTGTRAASAWGFIDRAGAVRVRPKFISVSPFSDGLAAVAIGERKGRSVLATWGFIDTTGTIVIPPQFVSAGAFSGGLAHVEAGDERGYIDANGRFVWKASK